MRTIALILLLLVILVVAVLLFNTFTLKSMQPQNIKQARLYSDTSALSRLSKGLQVQTVSYENDKTDTSKFLEFHQFLEQNFPLVHSRLKKENHGLSLLFQWEGKDKQLAPILLMAHQDVVPPSGDWEKEPFSGDLHDGYIYGRGTLDDKGALLAILESVESLLKENYQPKRSIYFAFGHDEELGGDNGNKKMAEVLKSRGITFEYVLDEGGTIIHGIMPGVKAPVAVIGIAEKGYLSIELSIETDGGHSSMPPAQTSVGLLSAAIAELQKHPFPAKIAGATEQLFKFTAPEMEYPMKIVFANYKLLKPVITSQMGKTESTNASVRTTMAPTIFNAGTKENVLPMKARAVVNLRTLPGDTLQYIVDYITKTINNPAIELKVLPDQIEASEISDPHNEAFKLISKSVSEVFPMAVVSPYLMLATTDSKHYRSISKNIYRFNPWDLQKDDLKRIHGNNERISTKNYMEAITFYRLMLERN
ncbi:M20 family peptidase [Sporocytophaga myxococcoides]|uniref:M20 family peptidase n=1 Tax=Sporocytophaga myxococcoides TaxID=153721 RepID=UPI00048D7F52|nr:M20 family peptidase [Sporocytophaga myxococcoides]